MERSTVRVVLLLAMFSLFASLIPVNALADESQAEPGVVPAVGQPIASVSEACDSTQFSAGEKGVTYQPLEDFGFVVPADSPDHNLYLTENLLPSDTCFSFPRGTYGASTFLVLEGTVEFIAWDQAEDVPMVWAGNENGDPVFVPLGAPVTLDEGDWVTVDRQVQHYAYRNPSGEDARIIMAIYELLGSQFNGCHTSCRRNP